MQVYEICKSKNYNLVTGLTFSSSGDVSHLFLGASSD